MSVWVNIIQELPIGEILWNCLLGELGFGELSFGELFVGEMSSGSCSLGKYTSGKSPSGKSLSGNCPRTKAVPNVIKKLVLQPFWLLLFDLKAAKLLETQTTERVNGSQIANLQTFCLRFQLYLQQDPQILKEVKKLKKIQVF